MYLEKYFKEFIFFIDWFKFKIADEWFENSRRLFSDSKKVLVQERGRDQRAYEINKYGRIENSMFLQKQYVKQIWKKYLGCSPV